MANGWLPRTGEEWMRWVEGKARIQERHRHVTYMGDWAGAIDGNSGMDTTPEDYLPSVDSGFTPDDTYIYTPPPAEIETSPDTPAPVTTALLDAAVAYGRNITASASSLRHGDFTWGVLGGMYEPGDTPDWITDGGDRVGLAPGFYSAVCEVDIGWPAAGAPDRVQFRMANSVGDAYDGWTASNEMVDTTLSSSGTRKGVQKVLSWGDFVISEDGEGLMLTADFYGGSPADDGMDGRLEIAGSGYAVINWYITRLGESPVPAAPSSGGYVIAESSTLATPSGYPTFTDWTLFDNSVGAATSGDHIVSVPAGVYVGRLRLNVTVVAPEPDHSISCNLFSSSAYVTYEFSAPIVRSSGDLISDFAIGPLTVDNDSQGSMSVSFFYPESAGVPDVSGSCTYFLSRIA